MTRRLISYRRLPRLAWSLWCLIMVLFVASFALRFGGGSALAMGFGEFFWWSVLIPAAIPTYATVGAVVVSRLPGNRVGWLCLAFGLVIAVEQAAWEYAEQAFVVAPGSLPAGVLAAWVGTVSGTLLLLPFMLMLLFFPDGRLPSRRWRLVAWAVVAAVGLGMLSEVVGPAIGDGIDTRIPNPTAVEGLKGIAGTTNAIVFLASPVLLLASVVSVFVRRRSSSGNQRQQLKWMAYAGAIVGAALLIGVASAYFFGQHSRLLFVSFSVGIAGITIGMPIAMGVAILRHRLYDIDVVINKTLVYGPLSGTLALTYFGGVAGLQSVFRVLTGQEQLPQLAVVASTLAIAALFSPLRRRVQNLVDRRFYRRKYDAAKTLEAFSARLRDEVDLAELSDDLSGVVRETVQPTHVSLWLRPFGRSEGEAAE